ncbi:uncharacterized protein LOC114734444 isoform X2 [Neltuma alba]|uniref:uncharacterized protein LOC114734444 isoform X2 n=1 Tax=Neltuma alba TaxID=207710 RepID=UPI0010A53293|nr:uncharacterized protein LOC114734444 isoform X2 [Prosopis alba]
MGSESKDKIGESGRGQGMPPVVKKVVQSLKEIVNCPGCTDQEIYAVLEECEMDPNRAVERLLAQDTFHEVKSKRERRKEMKEATDSRPRRYHVDLSRGGKINSEHNVHSGSTHGISSELGKAAEKGEVGSVCPSVTSSMTSVIGKDMARQQSLGSAGVSSRLQPNLLGASKGHLSMADIVRMGKPSQDAISHHSKSLGVSALTKPESSLSSHYYNQTHQQDFNHEWPVIEQPVVGNELHASKLPALSNANVPSDHFNPQSDKDSLFRSCVPDEAQVPLQDIASDNVDSDNIESGFLPSRHPTMNNTGLASHSNYNLRSTSSTNSHSSSDHQKDVSLAASDIQRLSLRDSKTEVLSMEDNSALVLPSHVQGLTDKCSHLSFGRFNSGSNSTSSATLASHALNSGSGEKAAAVDGGSLAQNLDASNSLYHVDKLLGRDVFKEAAIDKKYDFLSSFQQELVKHTSLEATINREYTTMSSVADPSFQKSQWMSNPLPFKRPGLQNGNMSTFSREMVMEPRFSLPQRSALLEDLRVQSFQQLESDDKRGYHQQTQNQQYLPPVMQQAFLDSSAYGHSLADMQYSHPQNRKEFIPSGLTPARGRDAFGFGNPGSYNPGSFLPNSSIGSMMPSSNFDDILPSQYASGRNGSLVQQHGGFSTWDYGQELRSASLPESMRLSSLGQPRQALPQVMTPGYSDIYHSGTGIGAQLQRQVGYQDFSSKQSRQFGNTATSSLHSSHTMPPFFH